MQTTNEIVINVQDIEPRLRHQTIFEVFDSLKEGESLIIHNNHDPKPVYYQLIEIFGEIFSWEYLQQGPEWWDIRVTKKVHITQGVYVTEEGEKLVNVPEIAPQFKHQTIFGVFEALQPGESMIIHNDHDPKPVYYQLQNMHGEVFTWTYLQEGPHWWDIRVAKNKIETEPVYKTSSGEIYINVPSIEPRRKHPVIFEVFDSLDKGRSLIIHNDHDPKPVYYELLAERGDVFIWEYLEQGPEYWDVIVTKKTEDDNQTIGQISAKDLRKAEVLKKHGINFSCGGKKTVREACLEKGIDAIRIEQELKQATLNPIANQHKYDDWSIDFLCDYIVNIHHNYTRKNLQEINGYAIKVAQVHGKEHEELLQIRDLIQQLVDTLLAHLVLEEQVVFPIIKKIASEEALQAEISELVNQMKVMEQEHSIFDKIFREIRGLSQDFAIPSDACTSYKLLYKMIQELEDDLMLHLHLENNILIPKVLEFIEK